MFLTACFIKAIRTLFFAYPLYTGLKSDLAVTREHTPIDTNIEMEIPNQLEKKIVKVVILKITLLQTMKKL